MENQGGKKPMILVIEPDPLMLTGISAILDKQGYRCFLSRDLKVAQKAIDSQTFDLFLLATNRDIQFAYDAAESLRSTSTTSDVPVIFLLRSGTRIGGNDSNTLGGVYFLSKPFTPHVLIEAVGQAVWVPHLVHARHPTPSLIF